MPLIEEYHAIYWIKYYEQNGAIF